MLRIVASISVLAAVGCVPAPESPQFFDQGPDSCGASAYMPLIGRALSSADTISDQSRVRRIGPGQPVAMDYRPDRINVEYDQFGVITRLTCG